MNSPPLSRCTARSRKFSVSRCSTSRKRPKHERRCEPPPRQAPSLPSATSLSERSLRAQKVNRAHPHTCVRASLNKAHGIFIPSGVFFEKREDGKARGGLVLAAPWSSGYSGKREVTANPESRCDENQISAGVRRRVPSRGVLQKRGAARVRDAGGKPGGGARRRISGTAGSGAPPGFLCLPAQGIGERQIPGGPKQQAFSHPGRLGTVADRESHSSGGGELPLRPPGQRLQHRQYQFAGVQVRRERARESKWKRALHHAGRFLDAQRSVLCVCRLDHRFGGLQRHAGQPCCHVSGLQGRRRGLVGGADKSSEHPGGLLQIRFVHRESLQESEKYTVGHWRGLPASRRLRRRNATS